MDYVVFGIGFGATLLVLGLIFRDLGPRIRYRTPSGPDGVYHAEELVARIAWVRFCGALGSMLALAGVVFIAITLICMLLTINDDTAPMVMGTSFGVLVVAMALWTWAFFDRFGSYGILPEREVAPEPEPVRRPESERREPPPVATEEPDAEITTVVPVSDTEQSEPRLQTPEERLAGASDRIDHDSAEADIDTPSAARRIPRRQEPPRPRDASPESDAAEPGEETASATEALPQAPDGEADAVPADDATTTSGKAPRDDVASG